MVAVFYDGKSGPRILRGNEMLTSIDGKTRAPLSVILHSSWPESERLKFGVHTVDIDPPDGQQWAGDVEMASGEPAPIYVPIMFSAGDIIEERARRLAGGFDYDFGGERGVVRIGTDPQDMAGWDDVTKLSNALLALGQPDATLVIVPESTPITITAMEWQQVLVAAALFRQPIWAASFALQAMEPIPDDYADDRWWQ